MKLFNLHRVIIVIFLSAFGLQANSQVLISIILGDKLNSPNLEFGLEGGYNWSNISGFDSGKPLSTFNLGFYFDIKVKNNFYFYTGVLVKSNLGQDNLTQLDLNKIGAKFYSYSNGILIEGNYSQRLNYFLVPALAKYRHKSNVYVEAGPQFGLMYKGWVEFTATDGATEATIKESNKGNINIIDVGAMIGTGYKFKSGPGWSVGVKYYYGFVDVYKNVSGSKNSSLFVKVNIPIGAGKKEKKSN